MAKHWTIVTIQNSEIVDKRAIKALFGRLADGKYMVEVNSANQRSSPQNRFYWGLVIPMMQTGLMDMGHELDKEEIHEFMKNKFNYVEVVNLNTGQYETIPQSTTKLNKEQFAEYVSKIQRFAAEFLSIVIPDPGIQKEINY